MSYNKKSIIDSKIAYLVLRTIDKEEEGSYPKKIAEKVDSHPSSISDILKNFREVGLVKRGKRTKAQFYELKLSGIYDFFIASTLSRLKESSEIIRNSNFFDVDVDDRIEAVKELKDNEKLEEFTKEYVHGYLGLIKESTIEKMFFEDLITGLFYLNNDYPDFVPEELETIAITFLLTREEISYTAVNLEEAIKEVWYDED
ncbi:MAG: hypothetical protein ACLFS3_03485 [Candidatus Aenigmatarchaeota archaeon]